MRHRAARLAVWIVALAPLGCDVAAMGPQQRERIGESRRLDPDGAFRLENTNGAVHVETWDEPMVSIEAEKVAPEGLLDDIRIEIRGEGRQVEVLTHHARRQWGFGRKGHVEYHVKVPQRARVEVETTNGALRVSGTAGAVRASTTNGSVEIADAAGAVEAATTNGAIRARFREVPADGWHRFTTTNGAVTLTLPADASGEFAASTVNGAIRTDFPLEVSGRTGGRRLRGRLGDGRARFELRTTNGSVKILKGL